VGLGQTGQAPVEDERQAELAEVATSLQRRGMGVEIEPVIGSVRPDIVATVEDGPVYIIELKTGDGSAHFSLIAQLLNFASAYAIVRPARTALAVLATTRDVPSQLFEAAEQAGVQIVRAPDVAALARSLVERLHPSLG